jgi:hypothetical protein
MRRFMVHLVTEVDFEDGDEASDVAARNYQKQLKFKAYADAAELRQPRRQPHVLCGICERRVRRAVVTWAAKRTLTAR